jgi:hypothetical protein
MTDIFSARARAGIVAVALLSLVATTVALVFGPKLAPAPPHATDSVTRGPLGHRGFLELAADAGIAVTRWTEADMADIAVPLVIVEPEQPGVIVEGQIVELGALVRARRAAGRKTVVVLPKWVPNPMVPQMVQPGAEVGVDEIALELGEGIGVQHTEDGVEVLSVPVQVRGGEPATLRLIAPQRTQWGRPVVWDAEGSFVAVDDAGLLMVVADPDLLHNATFHQGDNGAVALEVVRSQLGAGALVFAEPFHGERVRPSLAAALGEWPGVLFLAHVGALAAAIGLASRRRFGPPLPAPAPYGRGPGQIVDVAAGVLAGGTRLPQLAADYVDAALTDAHRALHLPAQPTVEARAEAIDQHLRRRGRPAAAVALLAESRGVSSRAAFTVARAAAELRRSISAPH